MKPPIIHRRPQGKRHPERGVTMVIVAIAMVAIVAMAAMSIDLITLYLARQEAQRSADAAALAAARIISLSGMTGDPGNSSLSWQAVCGGASTPATQAATAVGSVDSVGNTAANVQVSYSDGTSTQPNTCVGLTAPFGVNPLVTVKVTRTALPSFFSRIWGNTGNNISATATAEAFNPSSSDIVGIQTNGSVTPVQPRCVKPWFVPNYDPQNPAGCTAAGCSPIVTIADGSIFHSGVTLGGGGTNGVIGENFWLVADCNPAGSTCTFLGGVAPQANYPVPHAHARPPASPNLEYVPGAVPNVTPPAVAVPTCASNGSGSAYEQLIAGCDQSTIYQCGVPYNSANNTTPNVIDMSENPATSGDTMNAVQCLIHQTDTNYRDPQGQDYLSPYEKPSAYPFQMFAGSSNPITALQSNPITSSNSVVSLPIYDTKAPAIGNGGQTAVTVVGFLQVFINAVDQYGNINVTVLNVSGCGNGSIGTLNTPVTGSSPVPVRLITSP
jgi:Flp pilus assembly protein TadG